MYSFSYRWSCLLEEIVERLQSSKALLQLWQRYKELYEHNCSNIQLQEEMADKLLKLACSKDIADDELSNWIGDCSVSYLLHQWILLGQLSQIVMDVCIYSSI